MKKSLHCEDLRTSVKVNHTTVVVEIYRGVKRTHLFMLRQYLPFQVVRNVGPLKSSKRGDCFKLDEVCETCAAAGYFHQEEKFPEHVLTF